MCISSITQLSAAPSVSGSGCCLACVLCCVHSAYGCVYKLPMYSCDYMPKIPSIIFVMQNQNLYHVKAHHEVHVMMYSIINFRQYGCRKWHMKMGHFAVFVNFSCPYEQNLSSDGDDMRTKLKALWEYFKYIAAQFLCSRYFCWKWRPNRAHCGMI